MIDVFHKIIRTLQKHKGKSSMNYTDSLQLTMRGMSSIVERQRDLVERETKNDGYI